MNVKKLLKLGIAMSAVCLTLPVYAEDDADGCKDHPLFNRMPGYRINTCDTRKFDARDFPASAALDGDNKPVKVETVEGVQTYLVYDMPGETEHASPLQIQRNYQNAVVAAGGEVVAVYPAESSGKGLNDDTWGSGDRASVLRLNKGGREVWVQVHPYNGGSGYVLYIGEREVMQQAIATNDLLASINKDGYVALHINFDTGKASIKPDSFPQLDQVVAALKQAPALMLDICGHTDDVGTPASNQTLSETRASSVMKYLIDKGTAPSRLAAKGYGQTKPVADNRNEDGRAKNRRVELVKK
jgi:outer membrane protein OmpA-like peptidoglycan-associated protein